MNRYQLLSLFVICQVLVACSSTDQVNTNNHTDSQDETGLGQYRNLQISIQHNCIGCGRCVMVDPEHFSQNSRHGKALVKSQSGLDSPKLDQAIKICPTGSISLS